MTDADTTDISSAFQISSEAASVESGSEQLEALEMLPYDATLDGRDDTAEEHVAHRKLLQRNRLLAAPAHHTTVNSSESSHGPIRLKANEKLIGMLASNSRAFGEPGKYDAPHANPC